MMFDDDVQRAVLTAVFLDEDDGGVTGFIEEFWGVRVRARTSRKPASNSRTRRRHSSMTTAMTFCGGWTVTAR